MGELAIFSIAKTSFQYGGKNKLDKMEGIRGNLGQCDVSRGRKKERNSILMNKTEVFIKKWQNQYVIVVFYL